MTNKVTRYCWSASFSKYTVYEEGLLLVMKFHDIQGLHAVQNTE